MQEALSNLYATISNCPGDGCSLAYHKGKWIITFIDLGNLQFENEKILASKPQIKTAKYL